MVSVCVIRTNDSSLFIMPIYCCVYDLNRFSEASIRGILMACSGIITTVAMFSVYLLGSFLPWRHVAFVSAIVPILNIIVAIFVSFILI